MFFNELGVRGIEIGVAAFECIGVMPPHDHPHVYLDMGEGTQILCPYCSTEYRLNRALLWNLTEPAKCWAPRPQQANPNGMQSEPSLKDDRGVES